MKAGPKRQPQVGQILPLFLAVLLCTSSSCAGPAARHEESRDYGFIVVGPASAHSFGLTSGDTLPEDPDRVVPEDVRDAATNLSIRIGYAPQCTRYFRAGMVYVVLLKSSCRQGEVIDDGEAIAAYNQRGELVGEPMLSLSLDAYRTLSPGERPNVDQE